MNFVSFTFRMICVAVYCVLLVLRVDARRRKQVLIAKKKIRGGMNQQLG